jgi:hypothetical protein
VQVTYDHDKRLVVAEATGVQQNVSERCPNNVSERGLVHLVHALIVRGELDLAA